MKSRWTKLNIWGDLDYIVARKRYAKRAMAKPWNLIEGKVQTQVYKILCPCCSSVIYRPYQEKYIAWIDYCNSCHREFIVHVK